MDATYNQVLVSAFYDELEKISADLQGDPLAAFNEMFKGANAQTLEELLKQAGALDALKRFFVGGQNAAGIPMKGLLRNLGGESSYMPTMAENVMHGAREGGRILRGAGQELAGHAQAAAGKVKDFVAGGTQNGIPMQSLGQQLSAGNPFHGMMGSLRQNVPEAMRSLPGSLTGKTGPTGTAIMPAMGQLAPRV